MINHCGECRLCCKILKIIELEKPPYRWCKHVCSAGCSIYADRPKPCVEFHCEWLGSQDHEKKMPPELRPDRCGVVLRMGDGNVQAYVNDGVDHRKGPIAAFLRNISHTLQVAFVRRDKVEIMENGVVTAKTSDARLMDLGVEGSVRVEADEITSFRPQGF